MVKVLIHKIKINQNKSNQNLTVFPNKNIGKANSDITLSLPVGSTISGILPDPPTNVVAEANSFDGSIKVTFTPTPLNSSSFTSYTAVVSNDNSKKATSTTSPITINGLTPGNTYKFKVYSTNSTGNSELFSESNEVFLQISNEALLYSNSKPTNLNYVIKNNGINLLFTPPSNTTVTNYEYSINDGQTFTAFNTSDSNVLPSPLKARYIRFEYGDLLSYQRYINLAGIKVYSTQDGPNIISSQLMVTTNKTYPGGYQSANMVDNNDSTFFHSDLDIFTYTSPSTFCSSSTSLNTEFLNSFSTFTVPSFPSVPAVPSTNGSNVSVSVKATFTPTKASATSGTVYWGVPGKWEQSNNININNSTNAIDVYYTPGNMTSIPWFIPGNSTNFYVKTKPTSGTASDFRFNVKIEVSILTSSWVQVDLGSAKDIYRVELSNRQDAVFGRLGGLVMRLYNENQQLIYTSETLKLKTGKDWYNTWGGYKYYVFWPSLNNIAYGTDTLPYINNIIYKNYEISNINMINGTTYGLKIRAVNQNIKSSYASIDFKASSIITSSLLNQPIPSNAKQMEIILIGGGGGWAGGGYGWSWSNVGGGGGGGGSAGEIVKTTINLQSENYYSVTIGKGGTGGQTRNSNGQNGQTTIITLKNTKAGLERSLQSLGGNRGLFDGSSWIGGTGGLQPAISSFNLPQASANGQKGDNFNSYDGYHGVGGLGGKIFLNEFGNEFLTYGKGGNGGNGGNANTNYKPGGYSDHVGKDGTDGVVYIRYIF